MRTSLIEVEQIEDMLLKRGPIEDRLVTEAKVLSNPELKELTQWQLRSYDLIQQYGREKLHLEIKAIEYRLFHSSKYKSFQSQIQSIFKF